MSEYSSSKANRKRKPYSRFRGWMEDNNIRQSDVAKVVGKTRSTLSQNLSGVSGDLSLPDVRKICLHYNISCDTYFINQSVSK